MKLNKDMAKEFLRPSLNGGNDFVNLLHRVFLNQRGEVVKVVPLKGPLAVLHKALQKAVDEFRDKRDELEKLDVAASKVREKFYIAAKKHLMANNEIPKDYTGFDVEIKKGQKYIKIYAKNNDR